MIDVNQIKYVIERIIDGQRNYQLARKILDSVQENLTTVDEYEIFAELCALVNHHTLRLKCLQFIYTNCINSELLSPKRYELARVYYLLNQPEKSLFYNSIDLKNNVLHVETLLDRVEYLNALGDIQTADKILEEIFTDVPEEIARLNYEIGKKQLRNGDIDLGIKNITKLYRNLYRQSIQQNIWNGIDGTGKTLIVHGEHGDLGDQFSHFRFIKRLKEEFNFSDVVFFSSYMEKRKDIEIIYNRNGIKTTDKHSFPKDFLWANLSALPGYFQNLENNIWKEPYIIPIKNINNKLNDTKFKIGIKCNSKQNKNDQIRKDISYNELLNIIPENVSVYNFDSESRSNCINLRDNIKSWDDTLDYIDQMDLIISCDTSIVHAAGAMGKNTIVFVPLSEHYIWISDRNDDTTPWYSHNLKVVKQKKVRDWQEPFVKTKELINQCIEDNVVKHRKSRSKNN